MDSEGGDGSNSQEHYSNEDSYTPSNGYGDNSINAEEKFKDDSNEAENDKKKYEETDLNQIILDEDESHPDGAVPRFVIQGLGDPPEKPSLNGDVPLSNMSHKDVGADQNIGDEENNGCGSVDCMYYALLCCECSIL